MMPIDTSVKPLGRDGIRFADEKSNPPADWILVLETRVDELLIDDRVLTARLAVEPVEGTPAREAKTEGVEVSGADGDARDLGRGFRGRSWLALDGHAPYGAAAERRTGRERHGLDAAERGQALLEPLEERNPRL